MAEHVGTVGPKFQQILNFRDVGASINALSGQEILKEGLFFRSGLPDNATPADQSRLATECRLKTVVDLRTDSELVQQTRNTASKIPSAPIAEPRDPAKALRLPGVGYRYINVNGSAYSRALIKQLPYRHVAKLAALYVLGYRNQAISILGPVMAKRGLIGLAEDSLVYSTAEIKAIFDILSEESNYPLLVHCTQGKDRTGLVVLLVTLLLAAPVSAIERDYMMSESELTSERYACVEEWSSCCRRCTDSDYRQARLVQIRVIGLPDDFAGCAPGWATAVAGWIDENYGDVRAYLLRCGVSEEQQVRIRAMLSHVHEMG